MDIRPGRYRHFKGGEYEVLGIALHSKADLSPAVRMFLKYAVRMLTRQKKT